MRHVQEDYQMKYRLILIGGAVASAAVSITLMWGVWTGIAYLLEAL
jgi:hypothetical protein